MKCLAATFANFVLVIIEVLEAISVALPPISVSSIADTIVEVDVVKCVMPLAL